MYYYKVISSHWSCTMEFKSEIKLEVGQCFRILTHDGTKRYPTRLKVISVSDKPEYTGYIVNILSVNTEVESF